MFNNRPACSDPNWLFGNLLISKDALSPVHDTTVGCEENVLSEFLALEDSTAFVKSINNNIEPSMYNEAPTLNKEEVLDESTKDLTLSPQWITQIPSKFILGFVLF
jgi:hypothetical protein